MINNSTTSKNHSGHIGFFTCMNRRKKTPNNQNIAATGVKIRSSLLSSAVPNNKNHKYTNVASKIGSQKESFLFSNNLSRNSFMAIFIPFIFVFSIIAQRLAIVKSVARSATTCINTFASLCSAKWRVCLAARPHRMQLRCLRPPNVASAALRAAGCCARLALLVSKKESEQKSSPPCGELLFVVFP